MQEQFRTVRRTKDNGLSLNSGNIPVVQGKKYTIKFKTRGRKGLAYSAYFAVILFSENNHPLRRFIRWINDFSGNEVQYSITFTAPEYSHNAMLGYRINSETPVKSDIELDIERVVSLILKEDSSNRLESFDDINEYRIPRFPPLSIKQENMLESKIVWLFNSPRSGSTWLGLKLLNHPDNIVWPEPWLGFHLGASMEREDVRTMGEKSDDPGDKSPKRRMYDIHSMNPLYFFSPQHKDNWMPYLRKMILARCYSHAQTISKNLIIKEPNGTDAADIIMEIFPKSKLIFLLRDGRDVVDSRIDMHTPNSWANLPSFETKEDRLEAIQKYADLWLMHIKRVEVAYNRHDPNLRLLVKYEDLRKNTVETLKIIYSFIGIKTDGAFLKQKVDRNEYNNLPAFEKGQGKFIRKARPGGWVENFDAGEKELLNKIMEDTLKKFGYQVP